MNNPNQTEQYSREYLTGRIKELEQGIEDLQQQIKVLDAFKEGIQAAQQLNSTWGYAQAR